MSGRKLTTCELLEEKIELARATFRQVEVEDAVELAEGDAVEYLAGQSEIAFCFLNAEKGIYRECYDLLIPRMVSGGILVADNLISHASTLQSLINFSISDTRVDTVVVPIGKGILFCRRPWAGG